MPEPVIRPLAAADLPAVYELVADTMDDMARRFYAVTPPERTPERRRRAEGRLRHLLDTDPRGAWVAVDEAGPVGVGLASVRGGVWFLSLLAVALGRQGQGAGGRLLAATLRAADGCDGAWLLSSADPRALRRYALAGFDLHPALHARGRADRGKLPAGLGLRDGDLARDRSLVEDLVTGLRGAPYGPDLDRYVETSDRLLVADGAGFACCSPAGPVVLGALDDDTARRLLWGALAESTDAEVEVGFLSERQQWAVPVVLAAGLRLGFDGAWAVRGRLGPLTPYLPNGRYG
jgi:GNAT superfamily N-acetyltransferase